MATRKEFLTNGIDEKVRKEKDLLQKYINEEEICLLESKIELIALKEKSPFILDKILNKISEIKNIKEKLKEAKELMIELFEND